MTVATDALGTDEKASTTKDSRRWWALGVIAMAQLMVVLDATIVTIAMPFAQQDLHISDGDKQWIFTAYTLIFGGLLLLGGRLADYLGRRRILMIGLVGFAAASAVAGLAQNAPELFAGRALQGAFGALLAPAALSLVSVTFTEAKERARAFGVFAAVSGAGAALGLIAGGALVEYADWRWSLLVNTPVALLALVGAFAFVIKDVPAPRTGGYDLPGAITVTLGLISIVYGFSRAASDGWTAATTLALFVAGVALLAAFVAIERRTANPLLPLRIPAEINRGGAYLIALLVPIAMFAMFLNLSFYLQIVQHYSALKTGVAFLPFPAGIVVSAGIASTVLPKIGPRPLMLAGSVLGAAGLLWLSRLEYGDSYAVALLPAMILIALGMGFLFVSMQTTALHQVEDEDSGVASALLNAAQQVGGSIGTALLTTISVQVAQRYVRNNGTIDHVMERASVHSYSVAFLIGAVFFVLCIPIAAFMVRDKPQNLLEGDEHAVHVGV